MEDIKDQLLDDENVLWEGSSEKKYDLFFLGQNLLIIVLLVLVWLNRGTLGFFFIFVDVYLAFTLVRNILRKLFGYGESQACIITDKRILIRTGKLSCTYNSLDFTSISNVNYSCGLIDKILGSGSIKFTYSYHQKNSSQYVLRHFTNGMEAYKIIQNNINMLRK